MPTNSQPLELAGANHIAYTTWLPEETIEFYRDVMGLPLVHAITAKGWGMAGNPDFVHWFFEVGRGAHLAFLYYFGLPEPEGPPMTEDVRRRRVFDPSGSRHVAFNVETEEDLLAWRERLIERDVYVTRPVAHELLESIYFRDPNDFALEIARPLRPIDERDQSDAANTIQAFLDVRAAGEDTLEATWRRKGELLGTQLGMASSPA